MQLINFIILLSFRRILFYLSLHKAKENWSDVQSQTNLITTTNTIDRVTNTSHLNFVQLFIINYSDLDNVPNNYNGAARIRSMQNLFVDDSLNYIRVNVILMSH